MFNKKKKKKKKKNLNIIQNVCLQYPNGGNTDQPGALTEEKTLLSVGALDLVTRLLTVEPTKRLRNFLTLRTIKFFHGFEIDKIKSKQVSCCFFFLNLIFWEGNNGQRVIGG
ncbi:hypothetical protein O3M35_010893 [Rhynocoris fuscipes]|uniref:Uncharacterized protein n=1 Tax=Rhynocoris fuscipes TaxID=488301 RepID=A0AAW1D0R9_9HEMI